MTCENHPLQVYDLLRCKMIYQNQQELNNDLIKLNERFPVVRIKNKTGTHLSLVQVNFLYDFEFEGHQSVVKHKSYQNPDWTHIKAGKKTIVAEIQFVIDRGDIESTTYHFNH